MLCFGSVHCKGVEGAFGVSADSKEDSGDEAVPEKRMIEKKFGLKDVPPGVLRKSAEGVDGKGFR